MLVPVGVAARRLDVSREQLVKQIKAGKVPAVVDSIGRRFVESEVIERLALDRRRRGKAYTWPKAAEPTRTAGR
jgi:predicted site-specific integrase-resolvase